MQEKYNIFFQMKKVLSRGYKNVEYLFTGDDAPIMICITILKQFSARTITCYYFAFYIQYFTVSNIKSPIIFRAVYELLTYDNEFTY